MTLCKLISIDVSPRIFPWISFRSEISILLLSKFTYSFLFWWGDWLHYKLRLDYLSQRKAWTNRAVVVVFSKNTHLILTTSQPESTLDTWILNTTFVLKWSRLSVLYWTFRTRRIRDERSSIQTPFAFYVLWSLKLIRNFIEGDIPILCFILFADDTFFKFYLRLNFCWWFHSFLSFLCLRPTFKFFYYIFLCHVLLVFNLACPAVFHNSFSVLRQQYLMCPNIWTCFSLRHKSIWSQTKICCTKLRGTPDCFVFFWMNRLLLPSPMPLRVFLSIELVFLDRWVSTCRKCWSKLFRLTLEIYFSHELCLVIILVHSFWFINTFFFRFIRFFAYAYFWYRWLVHINLIPLAISPTRKQRFETIKLRQRKRFLTHIVKIYRWCTFISVLSPALIRRFEGIWFDLICYTDWAMPELAIACIVTCCENRSCFVWKILP